MNLHNKSIPYKEGNYGYHPRLEEVYRVGMQRIQWTKSHTYFSLPRHGKSRIHQVHEEVASFPGSHSQEPGNKANEGDDLLIPSGAWWCSNISVLHWLKFAKFSSPDPVLGLPNILESPASKRPSNSAFPLCLEKVIGWNYNSSSDNQIIILLCVS